MNEYNIPMKHVKKSNQVDFYRFTAYDQEVIISYFKNDIIFYGLELSPKCFKIIPPKIRIFYTTDGSHTQTSFHNTLFGVWGIHENNQMVCLEMVLYYDNES